MREFFQVHICLPRMGRLSRASSHVDKVVKFLYSLKSDAKLRYKHLALTIETVGFKSHSFVIVCLLALQLFSLHWALYWQFTSLLNWLQCKNRNAATDWTHHCDWHWSVSFLKAEKLVHRTNELFMSQLANIRHRSGAFSRQQRCSIDWCCDFATHFAHNVPKERKVSNLGVQKGVLYSV